MLSSAVHCLPVDLQGCVGDVIAMYQRGTNSFRVAKRFDISLDEAELLLKTAISVGERARDEVAAAERVLKHEYEHMIASATGTRAVTESGHRTVFDARTSLGGKAGFGATDRKANEIAVVKRKRGW